MQAGLARSAVNEYPFRFVAAAEPDPWRLPPGGGIRDTNPSIRREEPDFRTMTQFQTAPTIPLKTGTDGKDYIDYKSVDDLRRLMTPNGKIYTRKRLGASAREQRRVAQAIKRARYMALLPYTSATL